MSDTHDRKPDWAGFAGGVIGVLLALQAVGPFLSIFKYNHSNSRAFAALMWTAVYGVPAFFLLRAFGQRALRQLRAFGGSGLPYSGLTLAVVRGRAEDVYASVETKIDRSHLVYEQAAGTRQVGLGANLGQLAVLSVSGMAKGRNWIVGAVAIEGDMLVRYLGFESSDEATAYRRVESGTAALDEQWRLPLRDVPDVIEVSGAGNHSANVASSTAQRIEDVFFMHRGRRMVLGQFFNLVRDAATVHQYEVREFIQAAKRRARDTGVSAANPAATPAETAIGKGFDL